MAQALRLAERGLTTTMPNPRVGCVIVQEGRIVGQGWHDHAGGPHAEVNALRDAGAAARGATAYVTLEPCNHHGRTPPCVDALLAAGIVRVVAAMQDPDPRVSGQGLARLAAEGVAVTCGVMETEARALNAGFIARVTRGRSWVRLKIAASLDGRTALANGTSQWITGPAARDDVHRWRARSCALLTGIGTVLADDPALTVRGPAVARQPLRVVVDSHLRLPPGARVLQGGQVLVATAVDEKIAHRRLPGTEVLALPAADGRVDLPALLQELAARGINEVLVEAGATLNGALLDAGLVDELLLYYAPALLGDSGRGMMGMTPLETLTGRVALDILDIGFVGEDIRIRARPG